MMDPYANHDAPNKADVDLEKEALSAPKTNEEKVNNTYYFIEGVFWAGIIILFIAAINGIFKLF